jgi:hypothetical protein
MRTPDKHTVVEFDPLTVGMERIVEEAEVKREVEGRGGWRRRGMTWN